MKTYRNKIIVLFCAVVVMSITNQVFADDVDKNKTDKSVILMEGNVIHNDNQMLKAEEKVIEQAEQHNKKQGNILEHPRANQSAEATIGMTYNENWPDEKHHKPK